MHSAVHTSKEATVSPAAAKAQSDRCEWDQPIQLEGDWLNSTSLCLFSYSLNVDDISGSTKPFFFIVSTHFSFLFSFKNTTWDYIFPNSILLSILKKSCNLKGSISSDIMVFCIYSSSQEFLVLFRVFFIYLLPEPCCVLCGQLANTMEWLCDISPASALLLNRLPASVTAVVTVSSIKQLSCWRSDSASQPPTTSAEAGLTWGIMVFISTMIISKNGGGKLHPGYGQILLC